MRQSNTRIIAVFSDKESGAEAYLKQLDIPIRELHYTSLASAGVTSFPTIAIVDRNGVITDLWAGKLSPLKESALMSRLDLEDSRTRGDWSIDESGLQRRVANKEPLVMLDVSQRSTHAANPRSGARNIPVDELPVRAQNELPLDQTIVVFGSDSNEADLAYSILETEGFPRILILVPNSIQPSK